MVFSSNRSTPAKARATMSCDLPCCRGAETPTRRAAQRPSARSPMAASSTVSCHSSSVTPNEADRSATSSQELDRTLGACRTVGGACPTSSAPLGDFVDAIASSLLRAQLVDLSKYGLQTPRERGQIAQRLALVDIAREQVPQIAECCQP